MDGAEGVVDTMGYYALLNISPEASEEEVRRAYRCAGSWQLLSISTDSSAAFQHITRCFNSPMHNKAHPIALAVFASGDVPDPRMAPLDCSELCLGCCALAVSAHTLPAIFVGYRTGSQAFVVSGAMSEVLSGS